MYIIYILYSVCNCIVDLSLCYLDYPNCQLALQFVVTVFFLYSLAVLCLDAYENLTFMSCKTELS